MAQAGTKQSFSREYSNPTPQATQNLLYEQIGIESIKKVNDFAVDTYDGTPEPDINPLPDISD